MEIDIKILENGGTGAGGAGGDGGHAGSGDVSGYVGTSAHVGGSVPGIFNYNAFKKRRKRKKRKKHNESIGTSATGGASIGLGGEVYGMPVDISINGIPPTATGDLIESPISTGISKNTSVGIPINKKKHNRIRNWKNYIRRKREREERKIVENVYGSAGYVPTAAYDDRMNPNPGMTNNLVVMPISTDPLKDKKVVTIKKEKKPKSKVEGDKKPKVMNWNSYIKNDINKVTHLN